MVDVLDAIMGALDLAERVVQRREAQRARAAMDQRRAAEMTGEIDGLAEIERIRAAAGLAPAATFMGVRRATRGRWSPSAPTNQWAGRDEGLHWSAPPPTSPPREPQGRAEEPSWRTVPSPECSPGGEPPPKVEVDLGPREHVEGPFWRAEPEIIEAPITEARIVEATIVEATIIESTLEADLTTSMVVETEIEVSKAPEIIDAEIVRIVHHKGHDRLKPAPFALDLLHRVSHHRGIDAHDQVREVASSTLDTAPAVIGEESAPIEVEVTKAHPAAAPSEALARREMDALEVFVASENSTPAKAPTIEPAPAPPSTTKALRDALMDAEAARARPAEARRLYEVVLRSAARPAARFPETLYAALALQGTSECDVDLGDLDAAMANSGDAFAWAERAHAEHPSEETLQVLALAAQAHAQIAERASDRPQYVEVLTACLAVIDPALERRDVAAARQIQFGLRARLTTLTRPKSYIRKGALTPGSLTLTTLQGVRP